MEIKKEDLVRIRTFEDKFYLAFPIDFFDEKLIDTTLGKMTQSEYDAESKELDDAIRAKAEELRLKKESEYLAKVKALAEKKALAEEKAKAEADRLVVEKKAAAAAKRKATLEAKKVQKLKELAELEAEAEE